MNNTLQNRYVSLALVLILIVGAIWYISAHKVSHSSNVAAVSVVPRTELASSTTATTTSPSVASTLASLGFLTPAQKATKYPLAKEISDPTGFINTPPDASGNPGPITLGGYVGNKVVLLDFWTYSCINCERTLPYLEAWYQKYKDYGLVIVGVHTPEFDFEKVYANVVAAVKKYGITYPVVLDSNYGTWDAYANQYWPAEYLIDIDGYVTNHDIGEGDYANREAEIQKALQERAIVLGTGQTIPTGTVNPAGAISTIETQSPETYFGSNRNEFLGNGTVGASGQQSFTIPQASNQTANTLYLGGSWDVMGEYAEASDGDTIVYNYDAKDVYFVANADTDVTLQVMQDGKLINTVDVKGAQLYTLVQNDAAGSHNLQINIKGNGLEAFTFTFG